MSRIRKQEDIDYIFRQKEDIAKLVKFGKEIADRFEDNSDEQNNMYIALSAINQVGETLWI